MVRAEQWLFRRPSDGREIPVLMSNAPLLDRNGTITGGVRREHLELTGAWGAGRLKPVVQNLVSNAIRFSPDGGEVTLTVSCEATEAGAVAVLIVRDQSRSRWTSCSM